MRLKMPDSMLNDSLLNPITLPGENILDAVGFCSVGSMPKYPNISANFYNFFY
jgi:hypothetical protein